MELNVGLIVNDIGIVVETVAYDPLTERIYEYKCKEDERLIKENPGDLLKPKYDFEAKSWIESATEEEVKTHEEELEKLKKLPDPPSFEDRLMALEQSAVNSDMQSAMLTTELTQLIESQAEENMRAIAELTMMVGMTE